MTARKTLIIGCLALITACACIVISILGFAGAIMYTTLQSLPPINSDVNKLCEADFQHLDDAYNNVFTSSYKQQVSFTEFRRFYSKNLDTLGHCKDTFAVLDLQNALTHQMSVNYSPTQIDLEFSLSGKRVFLQLQKVGNSWLVNDLMVNGARK